MKIGYKTLLIAAALTTAISAHAQVAGTQPLSVTIRQSQALLEGWSVKQKPSCAMPTKRTRPSIRRRPARGTLVRYGDREVLGEARGSGPIWRRLTINCFKRCRPCPTCSSDESLLRRRFPRGCARLRKGTLSALTNSRNL
jgi:hypothetical protein